MTLAINEVKTQAKRLLKAAQNDLNLQQKIQRRIADVNSKTKTVKLKHCLSFVSQQLGFDHWHQAQAILSGKETLNPETNMGSFLYSDACGVFLNLWFSSYDEAKNAFSQSPDKYWLIPFKRQFILVEKAYLIVLCLNETMVDNVPSEQHNLYQEYGTEVWDRIVYEVIKNRPGKY